MESIPSNIYSQITFQNEHVLLHYADISSLKGFFQANAMLRQTMKEATLLFSN
jgi:hypothetical protein